MLLYHGPAQIRPAKRNCRGAGPQCVTPERNLLPGDNEARPDEMSSGDATPTVDPTSFGGTTSIRHSTSDKFDPEEELHDHDGIEIVPASDRSLGLTDIDDVPPDDWAADTGPTKSAETGERH